MWSNEIRYAMRMDFLATSSLRRRSLIGLGRLALFYCSRETAPSTVALDTLVLVIRCTLPVGE
jgi:hypothetical protein